MEQIIKKLEKLGFVFNKQCNDGEVYMSRKRGYTTLYATIEVCGKVNGMNVNDFIAWVKNYK